jgi:hypothetical protein
MRGLQFFYVFQKPEFGEFTFQTQLKDGKMVSMGRAKNGLATIELSGPPAATPQTYQPDAATLMLGLPDDMAVIQQQTRLGAVFLELISPEKPKDKIAFLAKNLPNLKPTKKRPNPMQVEHWDKMTVKLIHASPLGQLLIKVEEGR